MTNEENQPVNIHDRPDLVGENKTLELLDSLCARCGLQVETIQIPLRVNQNGRLKLANLRLHVCHKCLAVCVWDGVSGHHVTNIKDIPWQDV